MDWFWIPARAQPEAEAIVWQSRRVTYAELMAEIYNAAARLRAAGVSRGDVVMLEANFSPLGVAVLLALFDMRAIAVPHSTGASVPSSVGEGISFANFRCVVGGDGTLTIVRLSGGADHPLYAQVRAANHPGLVLFTSGSSGVPKGVVHDVARLVSKFTERRQCWRTIAFLLFDHIGGLDTLFYSLAGGSCLIIPADRSPESVCAAVERHQAEVLPVSPSFLNLLLLSEVHRRHELSSLRFITYGAEVMPEALLRRCADTFPWVKLVQRYGTSELGALRSHSRGSNSLWLKLAGDDLTIRVVEGVLQLKCPTAMLGYLNAPSPFTEDGWLNTGDLVEQDGEFIRVLGRNSDVINVGGEKVHPAEVEAVIAQMPEVAEVCVTGEPSSILGWMVAARVRLKQPEDEREFTRRLKRFCSSQIDAFKVPVRVRVVDTPLHNERQKLLRHHG